MQILNLLDVRLNKTGEQHKCLIYITDTAEKIFADVNMLAKTQTDLNSPAKAFIDRRSEKLFAIDWNGYLLWVVYSGN